MPGLIGRTPKEVFEAFRTHIGGVLNRTITDARLSLISFDKNETQAQVVFRRNDEPIAAPLTKAGVFLYAGQVLKVELQEDKTWKLKTLQYAYRIQATDNPRDNQSLRWEYVSREVRDIDPCRHHFQTPLHFTLGAHQLSLEDIHLPSGWVTIEEIIRFLIVDLGVPSKNDAWDAELRTSEEKFKEWTGRELG